MKKETYLTPNQADRLVGVFADEEQYTEHLKTLWVLRRLVYNKIDVGVTEEEIKANPLYKIFDLTNQIIGAIDDGSVYISNGQVGVDKSLRRG